MLYLYDMHLPCSDVVFVLFTVLVSCRFFRVFLVFFFCAVEFSQRRGLCRSEIKVSLIVYRICSFLYLALVVFELRFYCDGYSVRGVGTIVSDD